MTLLKKTLLFGINDTAEQLLYYMRKDESAPIPEAVVVDRRYITGRQFEGLGVAAAEEMTVDFPPEAWSVYLCIGYKNMNQGRRNVFERLKRQGYKILNYIHPSAQVYSRSMGEGNLVLPNAVLDVGTVIGNSNIFYNGASINHHTTVGSFNFFAPGSTVAGRVGIGDQCFFGAGSVTRNHVTVGDRTLVAMGASVWKDTRENDLIRAPRSDAVADGAERAVL